METNNTRKNEQEPKHETEQIQNYLVTNMTKNTRIARKTMFFIVCQSKTRNNKNKTTTK